MLARPVEVPGCVVIKAVGVGLVGVRGGGGGAEKTAGDGGGAGFLLVWLPVLPPSPGLFWCEVPGPSGELGGGGF